MFKKQNQYTRNNVDFNIQIVSEAMEKLMKGRTIFIIAHRLQSGLA